MYNALGFIGNAAIIVGFIAAVLGMVSYFRSIQNPRMIGFARTGFHITTTTVFVASAALLILIVKHQFQFHYIWAYSSRELPLGLLMSTFYAGQEGSFLLWTLMVAVVGIVLLAYTQKHDNEREVMGIYTGIMAFLLMLLIVKNPFALIEGNVVPQDGRGLNPLLQNFWMQIHPPILFLGFAAMTPPFVLAIAALMRRRYQAWVVSALPWVVGGSVLLGLGIALGGYWAYETLGWGGWWGWDPVENASLLPWLVSVALIHTMVTQKRTKGLILTNFLLSILAFVLVLYSTFLTRSGVLGDASVHSFVDPGRFSFTLLVLFMFAFTDAGLALLFGRFTKWGRSHFEKYDGWKLIGLTYLIVIGPSIPIFAQVSGDLVPIFTEMIQSANPVMLLIYYPMLGLAHLLNLASYLWLPALIVKLGLIVYIFTGRMHSEKQYESFAMLSRETWLGLGSAVIGVLTFIVLIGTSLPIIPQFIVDGFNGVLGWINDVGGTDFRLGNTVDPAFYDAMGLPLAILMMLMSGFTILLMWSSNRTESLFRKLALPVGLTVVATSLTVFAGQVYDAGMIMLALTSWFSLLSNAVIGIRIVRGNPKFTGAYIAHIGVAMMLLGVIGSGFYSQANSMELKQGVPVEWKGYNFTYTGFETFWNGQRYYFNVRLDDAGSGEDIETVKTVMFVSNYGGQEQIMRNPGIARFLTTDVYVEPQALFEADPEGGKRFVFTKGQTFAYGGYNITFLDFDMNNTRSSDAFNLGGIFRVEKYGEQAQELLSRRITGPQGVTLESAVTEAGDLQIELLRMTPNQDDLALSQLEVRVKNPKIPVDPKDLRETLVVQASLKPFMSFVWAGIIILIVGFIVAWSRRTKEARKLESYEIPDDVRNAALTGTPGQQPSTARSEHETAGID
ncbi:MAG: cytochrome c biogenesis protein CcsA [Bacteroidetes bacterium]|nr:cytochrome c biogenesis protein CcsA [Bacteroidota bacterium]